MTTPVTDPVADAQAQLDAAQQQLDDLEAAVVAGDTTITAEQIDTQSGLVRFYQLRLEAARRQKQADDAAAAEQVKADARDTIAALVADTTKPTNPDTMAAALQTAQDALAALFSTVDERNQLIQQTRAVAVAADLDGTANDVGPVGGNGLRASLDDVATSYLMPENPASVLAGVMAAALRGDVPATKAQLALARLAHSVNWLRLIGRDLAA